MYCWGETTHYSWYVFFKTEPLFYEFVRRAVKRRSFNDKTIEILSLPYKYQMCSLHRPPRFGKSTALAMFVESFLRQIDTRSVPREPSRFVTEFSDNKDLSWSYQSQDTRVWENTDLKKQSRSFYIIHLNFLTIGKNLRVTTRGNRDLNAYLLTKLNLHLSRGPSQSSKSLDCPNLSPSKPVWNRTGHRLG